MTDFKKGDVSRHMLRLIIEKKGRSRQQLVQELDDLDIIVGYEVLGVMLAQMKRRGYLESTQRFHCKECNRPSNIYTITPEGRAHYRSWYTQEPT